MPEFDVPPRALLFYLAMAMGLTLLMQSQIARTVRESLWRAEAELFERKVAEAERERLVGVLGERVKELRLLHAVARLLQRAPPGGADPLPQLVRLLPSGWQHSECCEARIVYGGVVYATPGWRDSPWMQAVEFSTSDGPGRIEIAYTETRPAGHEGPFLEEERATPGLAVGDAGEPPRAAQAPARARGPGRGGGRPSCARRTRVVAESLERLKELERLRDDLVHMVVHDMRSPLMALMMRLDLIRQADAGPGREGPRRRAAERGHAQPHGGHAAGREPAGEREDAPPAGALGPRVAGRGRPRGLSSMDAERVIELVADGPVMVTCDQDLVRRVLENLVSNGIKHTPSGGRLRIEVKALPGRARVTVQDEGARRAARGAGADLREVRDGGGAEGPALPLGRARPRLLQAGRGGARRSHRRGGRDSPGKPLLDRASGNAGGAPGRRGVEDRRLIESG